MSRISEGNCKHPDANEGQPNTQAVVSREQSCFFTEWMSSRKGKVLILLFTFLAIGGSAWTRWSGFEPLLIMEVEAEQDEAAMLYIQREGETTLASVPSLMNYYKSQQSPTKMVFELEDPESIRMIRFDPVLSTDSNAFTGRIVSIQLKPAVYARPLSIPFSALIPVVGVNKSIVDDGINLQIDAYTLDPQMELRFSSSILQTIARKRVLSLYGTSAIALTSIACALFIAIMFSVGYMKKPDRLPDSSESMIQS